MWFINCPSVVQCFLLAQLHLTLAECSARASPSASLSDPEQHMILVKSQVIQCYSTLSSSAPARQERGQWETQGKAKHRMKGAGWCGALHLRMRSWKILFGGEKRMTVWFWKESWWTAQEKAQPMRRSWSLVHLLEIPKKFIAGLSFKFDLLVLKSHIKYSNRFG